MNIIDGEKKARRRRRLRERPEMDEAVESEIRNKGRRRERLHGSGTGYVAAIKPSLDAGAVVGNTSR